MMIMYVLLSHHKAELENLAVATNSHYYGMPHKNSFTRFGHEIDLKHMDGAFRSPRNSVVKIGPYNDCMQIFRSNNIPHRYSTDHQQRMRKTKKRDFKQSRPPKRKVGRLIGEDILKITHLRDWHHNKSSCDDQILNTSNEAEIISTAIANAITKMSGSKPRWASQKSIESTTSASNSCSTTPIMQRRQQRSTHLTDSSSESVGSVEIVLESLRRSLAKQAALTGRKPCNKLSEGASVVVEQDELITRSANYNNHEEQNFVDQKLADYKQICDLHLGKEGNIRISDLSCCWFFYNAQILKHCRNLSLQRPKKKPLHEYYNDDDIELEGISFVFLFFILIFY